VADTQLTDLNITTSIARFLAEKFVNAGWAIHYQSTGVSSGIATNGEVTLVAEFPDEPNLLILPPKTRSASEVLVPAFAVRISREPEVEIRAGLGHTDFLQRGSILVDGFVVDQAQHMAFATMFRNWFRQEEYVTIYDYESTPTSPAAVDIDVWWEDVYIDRVEDTAAPRQARYYVRLETDFAFYE
jgi:hypothetical protein